MSNSSFKWQIGAQSAVFVSILANCCGEEGAELEHLRKPRGDGQQGFTRRPCLTSNYSTKTKSLIKMAIFLCRVDTHLHAAPTERVILAVEQPEGCQELNNG